MSEQLKDFLLSLEEGKKQLFIDMPIGNINRAQNKWVTAIIYIYTPHQLCIYKSTLKKTILRKL